jgi:putative Mg2+ transporter-C (MgtC) family protein
MIQVNLLLATAGKAPDSFIKLDLMRLPLGVLTGMGFIGGGAILRRGEAVLGVTTAATLWFVTILGLCFGGGQYALGLAGLGLGMLVLSSLKRWESHMFQVHRGVLTLTSTLDRPTDDELRAALHAHGFIVAAMEVEHDKGLGRRTSRCELRWRARPSDPRSIPVAEWADLPGVAKLHWVPSRIS